jgi:hypothetical protein
MKNYESHPKIAQIMPLCSVKCFDNRDTTGIKDCGRSMCQPNKNKGRKSIWHRQMVPRTLKTNESRRTTTTPQSERQGAFAQIQENNIVGTATCSLGISLIGPLRSVCEKCKLKWDGYRSAGSRGRDDNINIRVSNFMAMQ